MWWPLPSILSGKFGLSFSPFLKRINQENKNKEKRAVNAKRVILDWGFPARVNQHHLHWYLHLPDLKTQI
jgi:hypothetical protein